jgi:hypothetical protein
MFVLQEEAASLHSAFSSFLPPLLYSKSSGSAALLALTWTCLLVRIVFPSKAKRQGDIWNKLVGSWVFEAVRVNILHRVREHG